MSEVGDVTDPLMSCRYASQAVQFLDQSLRPQRSGIENGLAADGHGFAWVSGTHHERGQPDAGKGARTGVVRILQTDGGTQAWSRQFRLIDRARYRDQCLACAALVLGGVVVAQPRWLYSRITAVK